MATKLLVGSGYERGKVIWMDGTPQEIVERLSNRFKVYTTRPTKEKTAKVVQPKTKSTKTVVQPEAVTAQ